MTLLHDYFNLRNQQGFQRLLESADRSHSGSGLSNSGGKSWTRPSTLTSAAGFDVNARDWLGRTVLHLACVSSGSLEYVRLLLRHPSINVNLPDTESHWTPLHRALYNANIPTALLLLQRSDTDTSLQDLEGYTAFDLYNSTLNGTKPCGDAPHAELYTWGANRNAALGLGDGGDRSHPDQVIIQRKEDDLDPEKGNLVSRFSPIYIRQIQMSKLHTAVVTSESGGNLRLCGFGSGGRLGPGQHTQYSLKPFPQLNHTIVSVALGQDHTLALTKTGEILSWGLNRFSQLGYIVDGPTTGESFGRVEEPIQAVPRKIQGPLRKEIIIGVAASKGASACWTEMYVYTWGTNNGQLGYDKTAHPQILPRKATRVTQPVLSISLTDSAMVCLLASQDVICIWNDRHVKIIFPGHAFPSEMMPYRPPQAIQDAKIAKITSCDDIFAALSFNGELFTFSVPNPADNSATSGKERSSFKPQRVWALRKKFSAVKDVALGSDGSIIVCTESGHVFIRSRNTKSGSSTSGKAFKFQRLSHLQRVVQVCANSTGAFGALRVEHYPKPIEVRGNNFAQDIAEIQPYLHTRSGSQHQGSRRLPSDPFNIPALPDDRHDEDGDDIGIENDIQSLVHLLDILDRHKKGVTEQSTSLNIANFHGADVMIHLPSGIIFPTHRVILGARSRTLRTVLDGSTVIHDKPSNISLKFLNTGPAYLNINGCQPISVLILLTFLYSDELLPVWDPRVSAALGKRLKDFKINPAQIKLDLRSLAELLDLPILAFALESPVKRVPPPSLGAAMQDLFQLVQTPREHVPLRSALGHDVVLQLADKDIYCHSAILRARSVFFASFFDGEVWTTKRWDVNGVIFIDMKHLDWRVMEYVLRFICCGIEEEMFHSLDFAVSVEEALDFMFDVMAAANELLLDRLVLLCSVVILQHANLNNACYILAEATHLHAQQLVERIQRFMAVNMELLLQAGMLDDIPVALVKQLAHFTQQMQAEKSPISRSGQLVAEALEKHADWLALQDISEPIPRPNHIPLHKNSINFKSSPSGPSKRVNRQGNSGSPHQSPSTQPLRVIHRPSSNDDIFTMDDADVPPAFLADNLHLPVPKPSANPVWKAASTPRVDMKVVMAEAANMSVLQRPSKPSRGSPPPPSLDNQTSQQDLRTFSGSIPNTPGPSSEYPFPPIDRWRHSVSHDITTARPSPPSTSSQAAAKHPPGPSPGFPPLTSRRSSGTVAISGLGPMITPSRQTLASSSTPGSSVRRSSGKAWNPLPAQAPPAPSPPITGMSFAAIQQLQLDQVAGVSNKDKRSLREIQEEEKSLQEEANFLTWWTAEEERIKLEARIAESSHSTGQARPSRKRTGKKADQGTPNSIQNNPKRNRKPNQKVPPA